MAESGITEADIIREFERLQKSKPQPEGYTANELAIAWGCCLVTAQRRLRILSEAGRLSCSPGYRPSIDGKNRPTAIYAIKPGVKPAKKTR